MAKASATLVESPRNTRIAPSAGSARAPDKTNSPRGCACLASSRCLTKLGAPLHVVVNHVVEQDRMHQPASVSMIATEPQWSRRLLRPERPANDLKHEWQQK